jgi:trans-aconitate methyltransferase
MTSSQSNFGGSAVAIGLVRGDDYDSLPYLSLPLAYTQPSHLSALARLHGLEAPLPEQARVLEIGCAAGGNLLPLAAKWPKATFLGIDLAERQIADGNRRIRHFGLDNVTLTQADVADAVVPAGSFDFVICHGVFSWVPATVQDAILRLVGHCLIDGGVAAISYNVLPGWHLRSPIRDILCAIAGREGTPQERVGRARDALQVLDRCAGPGAYGDLLRQEANRLAKIPSSYILGEFLAEHNRPVRFLDFIQSAGERGLEFVCEADLDAGARALLSPEGVQRVNRLGDSDRGHASQELDYLSGRPFRRTVLRKRISGQSAVAPSAEFLGGLHMTARLRPDLDGSTDGRHAFVDRHGRQLSTQVPAIANALMQLARAYPATTPVDTLLADMAPDGRRRAAQALFGLASSGKAMLSILPVAVGRESDPRPKVWHYARAEAQLGLPGITSLHHVAVALPKLGIAIAAMMDGTRDRAELAAWLAAEIAADRMPLPDGVVASSAADAVAHAERQVAATLRHLADSAVLLPTDTEAREGPLSRPGQ